MSDFDGYSSGAILCDFLHKLGIAPIPIHHLEKQHGLSNDVFQTILDSNFDLLCLPDSGTNNTERCKILQENGTEVLILDHHLVDIENPYAIVINPNLSPSLNHALSGCGTTYKFIQAYCEKYNLDCPNYMDMVAVSVVSDVCDLSNLENRAYLEFGLNIDSPEFEDEKYITNPLLKLMFHELAKNGTTPKDVAWSVAPKVNALCRVGTQENKKIFFDGLIGNGDIEEALDVAKKAHSLQTRSVKKIVDNLEPTLDLSNNVIITYIDSENKEFSGLIANKISGKYHKPTLVLREANENHYSGSVRSPVNVASLINKFELAKCQGHESACGIYLEKDNIDALIEWFNNQEFDDSKPVTAILRPQQFTVSLAKKCLEHNYLWGKGVEAPLFYVTGTIKQSDISIYQKKTNTIKLTMNSKSFLKFRATDEEVDLFEKSKELDIEMIVSPELNEWRGQISVQGIIEEYEIHKHKSEIQSQEDWKKLF